jgi:hypothetical protein
VLRQDRIVLRCVRENAAVRIPRALARRGCVLRLERGQVWVRLLRLLRPDSAPWVDLRVRDNVMFRVV